MDSKMNGFVTMTDLICTAGKTLLPMFVLFNTG